MRFRLAEPGDFSTCRMLLHPALDLSPGIVSQIQDIWRDVATTGIFAIVEDPAMPPPASIQGFGASVFVRGEFIAEFLGGEAHHLDAALYDRIIAGRSPLLSASQIASANAAGSLNLVVLNFGLRRRDFADPLTQRVLQTASAAFYFLHSGYHLETLLNEVFGTGAATYMEAGGFRRCDTAVLDPRDDRQPHLFALRREWVPRGAVHPLSFLFHALPPQIGFSPAEQRVLLHALFNRSDPEIAAAIDVSVDAVKKTWRRIYDRVARQLPFLAGVAEPSGDHEHRTAERRRHLLDYLRNHLEEIRPWAAGSASPSRRNP